MNTRLLVDAIVRQTTVLIAQLSTAAGVRAPLAHVAGQVFLSLARELESQGVSRKVVADMFGLALRSYQKKVQRLTESATRRDVTLWGALLDHVTQSNGVTRVEIEQAFDADEENLLGAVLSDLVGSGLITASGRGPSTLYRATSEADRARLRESDDAEALAAFAWAAVFRLRSITVAELAEELHVEQPELERAANRLVADGRIERQGEGAGAVLRPSSLVVPVGADVGWEVAVFDHFQAMATAIAAKVLQGGHRARAGDLVGGATLRFGIHDAHPRRDEVLGLLERVRTETQTLWDEVTEYNRAHPVPQERQQVTFYFGQSVVALDPTAGASHVVESGA